MKIKKIILPLILALVFVVSLIFDKRIVSAIQAARIPGSGIDSFFTAILFFEKDIIFYSMMIILAVVLLACRNKKSIFPFLMGTGLALLVSFILKKTISRERPFSGIQDSFPSGHATAAFAPLSFFSRGLKIFWLVFACLLAFTRLWFGLHYLSDLIAGAVIGYYIPILINFLWKKRA